MRLHGGPFAVVFTGNLFGDIRGQRGHAVGESAEDPVALGKGGSGPRGRANKAANGTVFVTSRPVPAFRLGRLPGGASCCREARTGRDARETGRRGRQGRSRRDLAVLTPGPATSWDRCWRGWRDNDRWL